MTYDVIGFAKEELKKALDKLNVEADISVGLFEDYGIDLTVKDSYFDDAIAIEVKDKKGYVAGVNERSALIGVYRLLSEWGVKYVRPGKCGTYYPKNVSCPDVSISEAAKTRYRTVCIEGAASIENITDMIDWLPKVGFNSYYIQFNLPFAFFDRWYSHESNPIKKPEGITTEQVEEYVKIMRRELKRRGLLIQAVGHGWTCFPFGIPDLGWYVLEPEKTPEEYKNICAMINGERKVWQNKPLYTQLCFSNSYVKKTIVDAVVKYAIENPEVDIIHFWPGDYFNNTCECEECTKLRFSDYYVAMMNEAIVQLEALGLKTKLVFSSGYNKGHPPIKEKIVNEDRTILMFAPISRSYAESFPDSFKIKTIPEYKVNGFELVWGATSSVDKNLSYLYAWEQVYGGDALDFDYHLMWDHILDGGGEGIASVISRDVKNLKNLGMNGFISCQLTRNTFPTSIAMTVMAKTLWDTGADFDAIRRELYAASFGEDMTDAMCEYFETISRAFDVGAVRNIKEYDKAEFYSNMKAALSAMENFGEVIDGHLNIEDECQRYSWQILKLHRDLFSNTARSIIARLEGNIELGKEYIDTAIRLNWEYEDQLQEVLDSMYFNRIIGSRIKIDEQSKFEGV